MVPVPVPVTFLAVPDPVPVAVFNYEDFTTDDFSLIASDHKQHLATSWATVVSKISYNPISEKDD